MPDHAQTLVFSISTPDYLNHGRVALDSFVEHCSYPIESYNISLDDIKQKKYTNTNIDNICIKYNDNPDALRWSLKSALILYFLSDKEYENVIYIDNDIYFVNNNTFLIDDLKKGILLTKHNRPIYPIHNQYWYNQFVCNFTDGFFNAGFIGANKKAIEPISWWMHMNYWKCDKTLDLGLYVDQKYLDILALQFLEYVNICNHPGCNLAIWNHPVCIRSKINDRWKINNEYDPIFCHFSSFNPSYNDSMLLEYFNEFQIKVKNLSK